MLYVQETVKWEKTSCRNNKKDEHVTHIDAEAIFGSHSCRLCHSGHNGDPAGKQMVKSYQILLSLSCSDASDYIYLAMNDTNITSFKCHSGTKRNFPRPITQFQI